ncbi:MAG TPA: hypothetical protein VF062_14240 [Candidatus Limnocylindrales bacterium]
MSEDLVEFGSSPTPKPKPKVARTRISWARPPWLTRHPLLPTAALGVTLAAASLFGPWQKVMPSAEQLRNQPDFQQQQQQVLVGSLVSLGTYGSAFLLTLFAAVTAVALLFYGNQGVRATARLIGMVLCAANTILLASTAQALSKGAGIDNTFFYFDAINREQLIISLEWGVYAAFGGVIALGVVLILAKPDRATVEQEDETVGEQGDLGGEPDGDDDGVIDLSVSVHPVGKQVAAG